MNTTPKTPGDLLSDMCKEYDAARNIIILNTADPEKQQRELRDTEKKLIKKLAENKIYEASGWPLPTAIETVAGKQEPVHPPARRSFGTRNQRTLNYTNVESRHGPVSNNPAPFVPNPLMKEHMQKIFEAEAAAVNLGKTKPFPFDLEGDIIVDDNKTRAVYEKVEQQKQTETERKEKAYNVIHDIFKRNDWLEDDCILDDDE